MSVQPVFHVLVWVFGMAYDDGRRRDGYGISPERHPTEAACKAAAQTEQAGFPTIRRDTPDGPAWMGGRFVCIEVPGDSNPPG